MERIFSLLTEKDMVLPVFVTGVGYEEYQDHVTRKGGFHNYHLAICENGTGRLLIGEREYFIEKGMAFFFYPNIPHEYYPVTEPWSIRWIIFSGSGAEALLNAVNFDRIEVFRINSPEEVSFCYNKLYKTLSAKKATNMLESSGIFYSFLANINNLIEPENLENKTQVAEKLDFIIEHIQGSYRRDLSLEELAALAGVSQSYLCRIFKQAYGMSPFTYIMRCRINAAKEWLINFPDKSIKNIALESGFNNCSYFGAVFKEHEGCSPNQFRKLYSKQ
ncbi:MAG: AraC family transcriptional regulator [Bacillota bacterium]|nr:AraC family transcriptional regulator [Bacillota bacterium]